MNSQELFDTFLANLQTQIVEFCQRGSIPVFAKKNVKTDKNVKSLREFEHTLTTWRLYKDWQFSTFDLRLIRLSLLISSKILVKFLNLWWKNKTMRDLLLKHYHTQCWFTAVINLLYDNISTSETVFLELPTSPRVDFSSFHFVVCAVPHIKHTYDLNANVRPSHRFYQDKHFNIWNSCIHVPPKQFSYLSVSDSWVLLFVSVELHCPFRVRTGDFWIYIMWKVNIFVDYIRVSIFFCTKVNLLPPRRDKQTNKNKWYDTWPHHHLSQVKGEITPGITDVISCVRPLDQDR